MSLRPAPKHAPRVPFALLVLGLLIGGLVTLLALNTASAANEVSRHDIAAKDALISARLEQLKNEVAASEAPGNLARVAAGIGMVPAGNPAFLEIDPGGKVSLLGHPAPATAPPVQAPATPKKTTSTRTKTSTTATSATTKTSARTATSTSTSTSTKTKTKTKTTQPTPHATPTPASTTTLPGGTR